MLFDAKALEKVCLSFSSSSSTPCKHHCNVSVIDLIDPNEFHSDFFDSFLVLVRENEQVTPKAVPRAVDLASTQSPSDRGAFFPQTMTILVNTRKINCKHSHPYECADVGPCGEILDGRKSCLK